jgi:hypothetical protein
MVSATQVDRLSMNGEAGGGPAIPEVWSQEVGSSEFVQYIIYIL